MEKKLEHIWRSASMKYPVCILSGVTKADILFEISHGADTFEKLKEKLPLCKNNECASHSPTGIGCEENASALLKIYAPIWQMMKKRHCK